MSKRRRIVRAGGIFACSIFALLLWSKLKLVSGIPRTALATPEAQREQGSPAPTAGNPGGSPEHARHTGAPDPGAPRP